MIHRRGLALVAMAALSGCGLTLRGQLAGVNRTIADARDGGAYTCAPRELAMAETHAEFTADELHHGDYAAARSQIEIAAANARLAYDQSSGGKCSPKVTIIAPPNPPPAPVDSDGDGVLDPADRCPQVAGPADNAGCPWLDTDKDTVLDKDDRCPGVVGPVDNAGCPWPDRDGDGVVDKEDQCPDEPGPAANHGCAYKLIVVTKDKIELKQKVFFDTDRATIKPASFAMLDEIADALARTPDIEVRIEGHTDSRASLKHNLKLSQARATAVRKYLIGHAVDAARVTAIGYGPTRPIDDNRTALGREANRRVEFFITRQ